MQADKDKQKYFYRWLKPGEITQIAYIEQVCFAKGEALTLSMLEARWQQVDHSFFAAVCPQNQKVIGYISGIHTRDHQFKDIFFEDPHCHDPAGQQLMLLGLAVLPEYRSQGIARELMSRFLKIKQAAGVHQAVLTCLKDKVSMYEKMGFALKGPSASTLGNQSYMEMSCNLDHKNE